MSQSADTADADADENVDVVLESNCFSCPPTIVDEQSKVNVIVGVSYKKRFNCRPSVRLCVRNSYVRAQQRRQRRRSEEGSGGLTMKAAAAQRRMQNRRRRAR